MFTGGIQRKIAATEEEQRKGRAGTKAAMDRASRLQSLAKRLEALPNIHTFTYSPNGDNRSRDSLNHTEVIYIAADFLLTKPLLAKILVRKFPVLLIDESQDTKKELIDAFFHVQAENKDMFSLGLFGDTMQRIYSDGKPGLGKGLPNDWVKPEKKVNHRCPKRIVKLINRIRIHADDKLQEYAEEKEEGLARLFVIGGDGRDKAQTELQVGKRMAELTGDPLWSGDAEEIKVLTLEHHMAANRLNFLPLFEPLYACDRTVTGLLDGSLSELRLFTEQILPLIEAKKAGDNFEVARLVKKYSPLLERDILKGGKDQRALLNSANDAVNSLFELWQQGEPTLLQIVKSLWDTKLFDLGDTLSIIGRRKEVNVEDDANEERNEVVDAWDKALEANFGQIKSYKTYISGASKFGTHQGVKGLQFPRVMVIIDDEEARGFLFSYGKIFGDKELTKTDRDNEAAGKETSVDRTTRLFYVACSRAEKSLAVVAYSKNPQQVKNHVIAQEWFSEEEVEII